MPAVVKERDVCQAEQLRTVCPFITRESALCENVSDLTFGVHVFALNVRDKIYPVKQPNQSNSVGSRNVSRRRTPAFEDHLKHRKHTTSHGGEKIGSSDRRDQCLPT